MHSAPEGGNNIIIRGEREFIEGDIHLYMTVKGGHSIWVCFKKRLGPTCTEASVHFKRSLLITVFTEFETFFTGSYIER